MFVPMYARASDCTALAHLADAAPGPEFLPSYPTATAPALKGTAFVYDNALAVIALLACGDRARAARIGEALRIAATHDRFWQDGRLRNAYAAGPVAAGKPPALPGWWDAAARRWDEDPYAVGTATGNVAWAALALIALDPAHPDPAAGRLMRWVATTVGRDRPVAGYAGGFYGEEPDPTRLGWQSTEQNTDAAAAFRLLGMDGPAARARGFVAAMWDAAAGRFFVGTDGHAVERGLSGIDAELWPLIAFADAPAAWGRARAYVRAHYALDGGFGFRAAPDGVWTEGTAQAALILPDAEALRTAEGERAADGLLYATPEAEIRTGLALSPSSVTDDFRYYHLPHLGATAWAVLAETRVNPFRPR